MQRQLCVPYSLFLGLLLLALFSMALSAQPIPEIQKVFATMLDAPKPGRALKLVALDNPNSFVRASYKMKDSSYVVEVYASTDARSFTFGPSNVKANPQFRVSAPVSIEYRVLDAKPSYCLSRADGMWFLFVFPDQPIDVARFIERFAECWSFFEIRAKKAPLEDLFPSLIGTLPGVR